MDWMVTDILQIIDDDVKLGLPRYHIESDVKNILCNFEQEIRRDERQRAEERYATLISDFGLPENLYD